MANITKTTCDNGGVFVPGTIPEFADEIIAFAGADDLLAGTILARDSVSLKLVLFVKGGSTNQNGIPKAVLPVALSASADTKSRVIVKGDLIQERLVIDADASATNIDGAVRDQLRAYGLTPISVQQLSVLDP